MASESLANVLTPNLTEYDKPIFTHILARAWRYDSNGQNSKWRTRGKGSITIYYNIQINRAKLLFFDEKYKKVRLLQYIGNISDVTASMSRSDSTSESIEWIGNDYTMDPLKPLQSQWKLKFINSTQSALKFMTLYNYHIVLYNKYLNRNEFLEEQVCYICYDFIHDARLLCCGHIGCNTCIESWISSSKDSNHNATCPKCRSLIKHKPISCLTMDHIIKYQKELLSSKQSVSKSAIHTICICCEPYNSNDMYICCDYCDNWYHPHCVGIHHTELNNINKYKCPLCISKETVCNDEILIAEVPIKAVYRWDEDTLGQPCWKKRVIDTKLQFVQNTKSGKHRLIARDHETNKIKLDQFIYDYYRDTLQMKSKKSVSWIAMDSVLQTEYNKHERVSFAAKFYTEKDALDFKLHYCDVMNRTEDDHEEGQSVMSESISQLSRVIDIKGNGIAQEDMNEQERTMQQLFMDEYHANRKREEGMSVNEDRNDVYNEWKNVSIIAMKESVRALNMKQRLNCIQRDIDECVENTKLWIDNLLCEDIKQSEDMNIRVFVLKDVDLEHGIQGIYAEIDAWNGVVMNKNIICFNTYWKIASNDLNKWFGDCYFYRIIAYLTSYCHEMCDRMEFNVEDLYLLQCIYGLLMSTDAGITDGMIQYSEQLQSHFECIGRKHNIEWSKYIRNHQIKDCCMEWIDIIVKKIKMDLLMDVYMQYGLEQWRDRYKRNAAAVRMDRMVTLLSGHIGNVVLIQDIDITECTDCDVHRLCVFGTTTFIGIILNEWDYYGHDGNYGCNRWFQSPKGKGLLVPLVFVQCVLDDEDNNISAIHIVNTMSTEMQQKLELLPIDEQREWFNYQLNQEDILKHIIDKSNDGFESVDTMEIVLGDRVRTSAGKYGYVKYIGAVGNHSEIMYGLELDHMIFPGNDGSFNGIQYFTAASGRGYFTIGGDIVKVRANNDDVLGEHCVIVTNLSQGTGYQDLMQWLQKENLVSIKTVDVYKRNGLTEGVVHFGDEVDFKYILSNLNGEKLGDRYVVVFDTKECLDAVLCLNCSKKGHMIKDCPNSIEFSETAEWSQRTEEKSMIIGKHNRGITLYDAKIPSEFQLHEETSLTINDIDIDEKAVSISVEMTQMNDTKHISLVPQNSLLELGSTVNDSERDHEDIDTIIQQEPYCTSEIKVSNLPKDFDHIKLEKMFEHIGDIKRFDRRGNVVFLEYTNELCAMEAVRKYNGMQIDGCVINIQLKNNASFHPPSIASITPSTSISHFPPPQSFNTSSTMVTNTHVQQTNINIKQNQSRNAEVSEEAPLSITSINYNGGLFSNGDSNRDIHTDDDKDETYSNFVKRMTTEAQQTDIDTELSSVFIINESVSDDRIHPPPADMDITRTNQDSNRSTLYIGNIPYHMTVDDIIKHVKHVQTTPFCCIVTYNTSEDALSAQGNLQNTELRGNILKVENSVRCGECNQEWNGDALMVQCDHESMPHCNGWFHVQCVLNTDANGTFICRNCNAFNTDKPVDIISEEKISTTDVVSNVRMKSRYSINDTERYLCCIDVDKLYRWANDTWIIRTQQTKLEFYQHKQNGKIRITARDAASFKLKLNHWIPPLVQCRLRRKPNTTQCWQWNAFDATVMKEQMDDNTYSIPSDTQYIFCAKFKNVADSDTFYETFVNIVSNNGNDDEKANISDNTDWAEWKERELVKLKSLETLQWGYIGEILKENAACCQLQWTKMKRRNVIKVYMEYIRKQGNNKQEIMGKNSVDRGILDGVYSVLCAHKWDVHRLDVLWSNIQHEAVEIAIDDEKTTSISGQREWDIYIVNDSIKLNALKQNRINVDELNRLKQFYITCVNDPQNAEFMNMSDEFKGDEAWDYINNVNQADIEQLQYVINKIKQRISALKFKDWTKGFSKIPTESSLAVEIDDKNNDIYSMKSKDIIIPISGQIVVKIHPIGYGITINTHSNTSITNIKCMLSKKLGIDLYHTDIMDQYYKVLEDRYIITDSNIENNLILNVTIPDFTYDYDEKADTIAKLWTITTVVGAVILCIELTEEEAHSIYSVYHLKQKIFSVCNIPIPKQELFLENEMLTDALPLHDFASRCHEIRLLFIADGMEIPLFVEYNKQYIFLCLNEEKDRLSVIPVMLNMNPNDVILLHGDVVLDPMKSINDYENILEAESVINVLDNAMINIKIHCMCICNELMEIKIRKSQTIQQLKQEILKYCKYEGNDIHLNDMELFSYLKHKDLRTIVDILQCDGGNMYRLIGNCAPMMYQYDVHRLCDEYFYNNKLLLCTIKIQKKVKIVFPKHILSCRIKTFEITSFDPYLTALYEFVSNITKIGFNNIMLYSPDAQKHIQPEWSGERLIRDHIHTQYIVLYFMHVPGVMEKVNKPPHMLSISLKINDAFYCSKYHNKMIPFMLNIHDSIGKIKQEIGHIFPFFGELTLLKNSIIRMDDDNRLLCDYDLISHDYIEVCSVYPKEFEVYVEAMNNGIKFMCRLTPQDTIKLLKEKIETEIQRLHHDDISAAVSVTNVIFMGKPLLNDLDKTILEYSIREHSTIHAVLKMQST